MWRITRDYDEPEKQSAIRSRDWQETKEVQLFMFRLYDGDGNLYFEGLNDSKDDENAFRPLDGFGRNFGCTRIDYLQDNGKWEQL